MEKGGRSGRAAFANFHSCAIFLFFFHVVFKGFCLFCAFFCGIFALFCMIFSIFCTYILCANFAGSKFCDCYFVSFSIFEKEYTHKQKQGQEICGSNLNLHHGGAGGEGAQKGKEQEGGHFDKDCVVNFLDAVLWKFLRRCRW